MDRARPASDRRELAGGELSGDKGSVARLPKVLRTPGQAKLERRRKDGGERGTAATAPERGGGGDTAATLGLELAHKRHGKLQLGQAKLGGKVGAHSCGRS